MAEIMLALDSKNIANLRNIDTESLRRFMGVKMLANEMYMYNEDRPRQRFPAVGTYVRVKGANAVMLDTRFSYDKPDEAVESTRTTIREMCYNPKRLEHVSHSRKPEFITIHHDVPEATMRAFAATAVQLNVVPVCHLTSSRFSERDFELRGRTAADSAKYLAEFITKEASQVESVICAAADAQAVKEVNPDLTVFATGGILTNEEPTSHERPAILEETAPFVDVFIIGSPILRADDPLRAIDERFKAVAA